VWSRRARAVKTPGRHLRRFARPGGGLDSTSLDSIARVFGNRLYPTDTAAFGRESDIDSNAVVMVLMTNTVNKLVSKTTCQNSGFVAGFFYGWTSIRTIAPIRVPTRARCFIRSSPIPQGPELQPHDGGRRVVRAGHVHSRISAHDQL